MNKRRVHLLGAALALTVATTAAPPAPAQETSNREPGAIVGRVLQGGRPLSGVRVLAVGAGFSETTGGDGRFRMDPVSPGLYRLLVVHPERGTDSTRVTVADGTVTGLTLRYGAEGGFERTLHLGGLPEYDADGAEGEPSSGRSRVVGTLIDRQSSEPISAASVRLPDLGRQARSGEEGRFAFDSLPAGNYTVRVDHVRYGQQTAEVQVPENRTVEAQLTLAPKAIEVDPIRVSVDVRDPGLTTAGFYERRRWARRQGYGSFLEEAELDARGNRVSDVLTTVPKLQTGSFGPPLSGVGHVPYFPRYRQFGEQCLPAIYIDGTKIVGSGPVSEVSRKFGPRGINGLVNLASVSAIEVYDSPAGTAPEFQGSDSRCGVVVIWTKRGGG